MNLTLKLKALWLLIALAFPAVATGNSTAQPNIVIILADDLGIECLSSYGGISLKTPHLDKLASQSMRFTHCFSNPFC